MATIRDVAKLANVSVATVSRVLNGTAKVSDSAREAVIKARNELGFHLNANAKALAQQESDTIGVLVSDVSDPYFAAMVKASEEVAHKSGKMLFVTQGFHDVNRELRALNSLISRQCNCLVIHALAIPDPILSRYMRDYPYMVLVNRILKGFEDRCVNINNSHGMYLIVRELIRSGCRKIAYVNSAHRILDADERLSGYYEALHEAGLDIDSSLVFSEQPYLEGGFVAAERLLSMRGRFDAVACYNDALASALIARFVREGIDIPGEISVTGFDNLPLSVCLNPTLTTITNPVNEMGRCAAELSLALYAHKEYKLPEFRTEIIRRESVISPKKEVLI